MHPRLVLVMLASCWLAGSANAQAPVKSRTDSLGDPLPDGAVARLGTMRFKHDPGLGVPVTTAIFSPNGKYLATGQINGPAVCLWDVATGKRLPGSWQSASILCFSPDDAILATVSFNSKNGRTYIELWDVASGKELRSLKYPDAVQTIASLAFAEGGKTLVSASTNDVYWWDVATGNELRSWMPFGASPKIKGTDGKNPYLPDFNNVLSPDGTCLAVQVMLGSVEGAGIKATQGETLFVDLAAGKELWRVKGQVFVTKVRNGGFLTVTNHLLNRLVFSRDGKRVALAVALSKVELRDAGTGNLIASPSLNAEFGGDELIGALALSPDGTKVAIVGGMQILMWNPLDGALRSLSSEGRFSLTAPLTFSPNNKLLLVSARNELHLYDVATLKEVNRQIGHCEPVEMVTFSADGQRMITRGAIDIWSSDEFRVGFSGGSKTNVPANFLSWDLAAWKPLPPAADRLADDMKTGDFSPERTFFVSRGNTNPCCLYETGNGKLLGHFLVPESQQVNGQGFFSPSGKYYLLSSQDNGQTINRLYAVPSCKLVSQWLVMAEYFSLSFSGDERWVALAGNDGLFYVIETASGKVLRCLGKNPEKEGMQLLGYKGRPPKVALSHDGRRLASWNLLLNAIIVWDVTTGKQCMHNAVGMPVSTNFTLDTTELVFAWSPDIRMLAVSTNADRGKIRLWEIATKEVRRELSGHEGDVRSLAFSPDGRWLASGSTDTTVLVWDVWGR